jgi:putative transcriptional regulator
MRFFLFGALLALIVGITGKNGAAAESAVGRFLVAEPSLEDPNFSKSVVLIIRHGDGGAFGLIINRFVKLTSPKEILALFNEEAPESNALVAVHIGGPVQPASTLVHHSAEFKVERTAGAGDLFAVSPTVDTMIATVRGKGPLKMQMFFGYAGWAPGQLEQEIDSWSWVLIDADRDLVFSEEPSSVWRAAQARIRVDL